MSTTDELYQQVILDYNKSPRNYRHMDDPTHHATGLNPLCGDAYDVFLKVGEDGVIEDVSFEGQGCAISKASASLMTQEIKGKTVEEAKALFESFHALLVQQDTPEDVRTGLGKLRVFAGVWRYPARVKCAALAWHALETAIKGGETVSTEDTM